MGQYHNFKLLKIGLKTSLKGNRFQFLLNRLRFCEFAVCQALNENVNEHDTYRAKTAK